MLDKDNRLSEEAMNSNFGDGVTALDAQTHGQSKASLTYVENENSKDLLQRRRTKMYRRRNTVVTLLTNVLIVLMTVRCFNSVLVSSAHAQSSAKAPCLPNEKLAGVRIDDLPISKSDGLRHATYRFVDFQNMEITPPNAVVTAVERGSKQWNDQSKITGVVFERAAPGQPATINFTMRSTDKGAGEGKCASTYVDRVNYGPNFERRAKEGPNGAAFIMAHELGHTLGLGDQGKNPRPFTVMNNLDSCTDSPVTSSVTRTDAQRVPACLGKARDPLADMPLFEDRPTGTSIGGLACYARYEVTNFYTCDEVLAVTGSTCKLDRTEYQYITTLCY